MSCKASGNGDSWKTTHHICQGWVASILKFKKDWLQMYKNDDKL